MTSKSMFPTINDDVPLNTPVRYYPKVDDEFLKATKTKLSLARFPEEQDGIAEDDWSQGAKVKEVQRLARFWQDEYDWKAQEVCMLLSLVFSDTVRQQSSPLTDLNTQDRIQQMAEHFLVKLDVPGYGLLDLHFVHRRSTSPHAIPLLFRHGWPGSFLEARHILSPLTTASPSTTPSPSTPGLGPSILARAYKLLMTSVLGYTSGFAMQGGDFGAFISRSIAIQYPDLVIAQHLNMFPKAALEVRQNFERDQSGYLEAQKTRPQTLGTASVVRGEVPHWVDIAGNRCLPDTEIVDLVMMHWIQGATPGLRFYREAFWSGRRDADETFETYVGVPTGVSMYAREQLHVSLLFWEEGHCG
ncbi:hypothetical protein H2199_005390 [Coniosporium tulheliwenetii]|uniref:Uncharacterized protein n=1 Tax=Coniosporium tulheliwenetii TaxID=3383036 RepID=A0ACC2Z134_9PEZI|nr:hypothetical protein H2199_005390 [Cladosporium sp. JES 115]